MKKEKYKYRGYSSMVDDYELARKLIELKQRYGEELKDSTEYKEIKKHFERQLIKI